MYDAALAYGSAVVAEPWAARMVRPLADRGVGMPASFLRKRFALDSVAGSEILRLSALGLYICFINGKRVGRDVLTPGWTSYDKRLSFQAYSVAELLVAGDNVIEIWLADGWLRSQLMWGKFPIHNTYGDQIAAIAELRQEGAVLVATDDSWESGELPVRKSGIYFGELFDARIGAAASAGSEAIAFDLSRLVASETTPVRELESLRPSQQWRDEEGRAIYDFAQNVGGYVAFTVRGAAGAKVIVEHAEVLDKDGNFYNVNYRTAEARVEYTLAGRGEEAYRPHFTFQGFRYARVSIEGEAELLDIVSVPISSVSEVKSGFTSGNALVDRLFLNTMWSQRGNFIDVPTDCPQRDERLGWTGDAQVFAGTAMYLAETQGFFRKWMRDLMVDQREDGAVPHVVPDPTRLQPEHYPGFYGSTGWGDAVHVVPWQLYLHYGDSEFLAEALPAMVKWVDFIWSISDGPIVSPPREWGARGFSFGDWLQPKGPSAKPLPTIGDDAAATIYLHIAAKSVANIAALVGDEAIATRLGEMADKVKAAFAREFITASGRLAYDDQTSYALAIVHDLIPAEKYEAAKNYFKATIDRADRRIGTGFIGTPALLPALIKIGEWGLASEVFLQEEVPGWLYQVKMGATTIWERWDAIQADGSIYNPQMNSYNHYAYGAVCQWLLEGIAGFRPDEQDPAFKTIWFEPVILPELSPVKAHHHSRAGTIRAEWAIQGEVVRYEIELPEGSRGRLRLASVYADARLDGQAIEPGADTELKAGKHIVTFTYSAPKREERSRSRVNANTP